MEKMGMEDEGSKHFKFSLFTDKILKRVKGIKSFLKSLIYFLKIDKYFFRLKKATYSNI